MNFPIDVKLGRFNCHVFEGENDLCIHIQCPSHPEGDWTDLWQLEEGWGFMPDSDKGTQIPIATRELKRLVVELETRGLYYQGDSAE